MPHPAIEVRLNAREKACPHCGVPVGDGHGKRCWHCFVDLDAAESDPPARPITAQQFAEALIKGTGHLLHWQTVADLFQAALDEGKRQAEAR